MEKIRNLPAKRFLVTGGAGFIGAAVIRFLFTQTNHQLANVDKLTCAGNLESLTDISDSERYHLEQVDVCDAATALEMFAGKGGHKQWT